MFAVLLLLVGFLGAEEEALSDELWLKYFQLVEVDQKFAGTVKSKSEGSFPIKIEGTTRYEKEEDGWHFYLTETSANGKSSSENGVWRKVTEEGRFAKDSPEGEPYLEAPRPLVLGQTWVGKGKRKSTFVGVEELKLEETVLQESLHIETARVDGSTSAEWFVLDIGSYKFTMENADLTMILFFKDSEEAEEVKEAVTEEP